MFCPKCGDEFRVGFAACPDCSVSLVEELPRQEEPGATEGVELVTVATFQNMFDASVARGALEAEGLPAFIPGESLGAFSQVGPRQIWAELKVRASDRDRAVELLRQAGHR
ncbi:MAG: DUF2007 domain-containing protein [Thermoanaerobaculia bacterium]